MILVFIGLALCTLAFRASFIVTGGGTGPKFEALRRYMPVAALTAIIVPALFPHSGEPNYVRPLAALIAVGVAYRFKNILATVAVGLAVLLLLK